MRHNSYSLLVITGLLFCCNPVANQECAKKIEALTATQEVTITNLYDAFGKPGNGLIKDFGFSALIKYQGKLILFDAGTNADILKNNVETLGIDLGQVDYAIASHAHGDHINGFDYLLQVNPDVKIYLPFDFFAGAKLPLTSPVRNLALLIHCQWKCNTSEEKRT